MLLLLKLRKMYQIAYLALLLRIVEDLEDAVAHLSGNPDQRSSISLCSGLYRSYEYFGCIIEVYHERLQHELRSPTTLSTFYKFDATTGCPRCATYPNLAC